MAEGRGRKPAGAKGPCGAAGNATPSKRPSAASEPAGADCKTQCQACAADLSHMRAYNIKKRICNDCMRADEVLLHTPGAQGMQRARFCFQCGRLEDLTRFDTDKRSCRERLQKRRVHPNASRACRRVAPAPALSASPERQPGHLASPEPSSTATVFAWAAPGASLESQLASWQAAAAAAAAASATAGAGAKHSQLMGAPLVPAGQASELPSSAPPAGLLLDELAFPGGLAAAMAAPPPAAAAGSPPSLVDELLAELSGDASGLDELGCFTPAASSDDWASLDTGTAAQAALAVGLADDAPSLLLGPGCDSQPQHSALQQLESRLVWLQSTFEALRAQAAPPA